MKKYIFKRWKLFVAAFILSLFLVINLISTLKPNVSMANWKTYTNAQFGYSIKYPMNWKVGSEAGNNDSDRKTLYKDSNNEILVHSTHSPSSFSTQNADVGRKIIKLTDGREAISMNFTDESNKVHYLVIITEEGSQYVFNATLKKDFYYKNKSILEEVSKSLSISPSRLQNINNAVFNLNGGAPSLKYFISQINAPSNYFATDDNMIESYITQGGMAPPRIILMKNYQVAGGSTEGKDDYYSAIYQRKNECIVIWSTNELNSIDDWNTDVTSLKGNLTEPQKIIVGVRKAQMYKMLRSEGDIYVALLQIGNEDSTSYYFHTCNTNNKSDFVSVIQSIKFRDDVPNL